MSIESVLSNASLVKGFLSPLFYDETGQSPSGLTRDDFQKVVDGYACARCLAEYVTYLPKCPVCQLERNLEEDLRAPDPLQVAHLRERTETVGQDIGRAKTFDEMMRDVERNRDIDHVPLSKLMPSKRGRK